jgi:hypothetical protein
MILSGNLGISSVVHEEDASRGAQSAAYARPEPAETIWRNVREPESEEDKVECLVGFPLKKISAHVPHVGGTDTALVELEGFTRGIDRDYEFGEIREMVSPKARTASEFESPASVYRLAENFFHVRYFPEPGALMRLASVVPSSA